MAEREARLIPSLNVSVMAGLLLIAGSEEELAAFLARLEGPGVVDAVVVEVDGSEEQSQDFKKYILERTDAVSVIATLVRGPAR